MKAKNKILYKTPYFSVKQLTVDNNKDSAYFYISDDDEHSMSGIAILPFIGNSASGIKYLLRNELTPPWGFKRTLSSITGGYDKKDKDYAVCAIRELKEETGFEVNEDELIHLGTSKTSKCFEYTLYCFAADITGKKNEKPKTDGSFWEKYAKNIFVNEKELIKSIDPVVHLMYNRLKTLYDYEE